MINIPNAFSNNKTCTLDTQLPGVTHSTYINCRMLGMYTGDIIVKIILKLRYNDTVTQL